MASTFTQIPSATANTAGVTSFTSRAGAVVGASGDYEADQITYDNAGSGLSSTEAQGAIDEIALYLTGTLMPQVDAINPAPKVLLAAAMTETERDGLVPDAGWIIFNSDTVKLQVYTGVAWVNLH